MMREQLLATVEQLVTSIEHVSGLPEYVHGESCGVRTRTSRQDCICKGYTSRHLGSELQLARMISSVLFELTLWPDVIKRDWQLHAMPDTAMLSQAAQVAKAYYAAHPIGEERQ